MNAHIFSFFPLIFKSVFSLTAELLPPLLINLPAYSKEKKRRRFFFGKKGGKMWGMGNLSGWSLSAPSFFSCGFLGFKGSFQFSLPPLFQGKRIFEVVLFSLSPRETPFKGNGGVKLILFRWGAKNKGFPFFSPILLIPPSHLADRLSEVRLSFA